MTEERREYIRQYMCEYVRRPGVKERINARARERWANDPEYRERRKASARAYYAGKKGQGQ